MSWYNPNGVAPGWGGNFPTPNYPQGIANAPQQAPAPPDPSLMQRLMGALGNPSMNNIMNSTNALFAAGAPRTLPSGAVQPQAPGPQANPSIMNALSQLQPAGGSGLAGVAQPTNAAAASVNTPQLMQLLQQLQRFRNQNPGQ